jgi:hypothetical protein
MQRTSEEKRLAQPGRPSSIQSMQWILWAMIFGMVSFAAIALAIDPTGGDPQGDPMAGKPDQSLGTILLVATALVAASSFSMLFFLRRRALQSAARRGPQALEELERGTMPPELARGTIVCGALAESVGLLGIATFFLSRQWVALVALAAALLAILLLLPTKSRLSEAIRSAG